MSNMSVTSIPSGPPKKKSIAQQLIKTRAMKASEKTISLSESLSRMTAPAAHQRAATEAGASMTTVYEVPVLPDNATTLQRKSFLMLIASTLRHPKEVTVNQAIVALIAFFDTVYRPVTRKTSKIEWKEIPLSKIQVANLDKFLTDGFKLGPSNGPDYKNNYIAFAGHYNLPGLAAIGQVSERFFSGKFENLMFYGYAGLLLFSLHKDPDGSGKRALNVARPDALRAKYRKTKEEYPLWSAFGVPSDKGWTAISGIWNLIPMTRFNWFERFIEFGKELVSAEDEALFLNVRLMRFSDLNHIALITQALNEFDIIRYYSPLAGEIDAFDSGIRQMYELAPSLRSASGNITLDVKGQPIKDTYYLAYLKVLYGDKKDIAKRNTMPFLLVCCVRSLALNHPELANYTLPVGYDIRYNEFRAWKDSIETEILQEGE